MKLRTTALVACSMLLLAGCGAEPDKVEQATSVDSGASAPAQPSAEPGGSILETGFGQRDIYVQVVALVQNTSDKVGQTVTVQFNVLDSAGTLLKSESHVETFTRPGQKLPMTTQVDLEKGQKAAKVEATLLVEDKGNFSSEPSIEVPTGPAKITKSEYGDSSYDATFEVINPKPEPLKDVRIGVICYDAAKKVIGGTSAYPDLIPPSGKIVVETTPITTGKPASCVAYAAPAGW